MKQNFFIINEESNTNILGLNPIVRAFCSDEMKKLTGSRLTTTAYEFEKGKFRIAVNFQEWHAFADYLLEKIKKDKRFEMATVRGVENAAAKIYVLCESTRKKLKQGKFTEKERKEIIWELFALFETMCVFGLVGPIIEIVDGKLSAKLEEIFKAKATEKTSVSEFSSLLTSRFEEGYDQKGQKALAKITEKIFQSKKYKRLFSKSNAEIKKQSSRELINTIEKYVFNWGWLKYGYCGPEYALDSAITDIKHMLEVGISPAKQIRIREQSKRDSIRKQKKLLKQAKFNPHELYLIRVAQDFTETKNLRAKMMSLADCTINRLLKSLVVREGISFSQLGVCTVSEVLSYLDTGRLPAKKELDQRMKYCVLLSGINSEKFLIGQKAKSWIKNNIKIEKIDKSIKEITGQVACKGSSSKIRGVVKIVDTAAEMQKFSVGDILVSIATIPEIVPAMKKAAAIITDIGGLTCHAAIVSRELNKPCVIGTKIATKVLKDGDLVEVDADRGIIKFIK